MQHHTDTKIHLKNVQTQIRCLETISEYSIHANLQTHANTYNARDVENTHCAEKKTAIEARMER